MQEDHRFTALCQALISDAEFAALFAPPRLRAVLPPADARGVAPVLWLVLNSTRDRGHPHRAERWRLPGLRFDHVDERPRLLAECGTRAAAQRLLVAAAVVLSEAWERAFTPAERAARQGRLLETYADKVEVVVVMGRTLDGRSHLATAPLQRRASGRIAGYGAWHGLAEDGTPQQGARALLLEHFFRAYLVGMIGDPGFRGAG